MDPPRACRGPAGLAPPVSEKGPQSAGAARLVDEAVRRGFTPEAAGSLVRYVEAVLDENRRVNLTGAKSLDDALDVLALDAVPVGSAWERAVPPRFAVDLGTGNGLPGVAVALRWPTCRVTLVERREKKAKAVERCVAAAAVAGVEVVACDGRELLRARPRLRAATDLVVVRAVGDLAPTTREAAPWLAPGGLLVHWKSEGLEAAERDAGLEAARAAGLRPLTDVEFRVGDRATGRRLVRYERPGGPG